MNEAKLEEWLQGVLEEDEKPKRVRTFEDASLLTRNKGLEVRFSNGDAFLLTIVQSEQSRESDDEDNE